MSTTSFYRPDIDGLRAVAVLSVMIYHLNGSWLPGGFAGVDVFFVISGFVVAGSLATSQSRSFGGFIGEFYVRRLARIVPALVVVLLASAVVATAFIPFAWLSAFSETTAKFAFLGLANWFLQEQTDVYFAPRAELNPYMHTWSLGVEEQFYVLAPFLVFLWLRSQRQDQGWGVRLSIGTLGALALASLAYCAWIGRVQPTTAFYFIGCRLWELAFGVLLFLATCGRGRSGRIPMLDMAVPWLGLACIALAFVFVDARRFPWPWALLPVVGTLSLIGSASLAPNDWVRRMLSTPPALWIGKRSYSLYLWHWPVYVAMRWTAGLDTVPLFLAAVAGTFALAAVSYRFVEQPLRRGAWIERRAKWTRIAGFLLLLAIGLSAATHLFDNRSRYSLSRVSRQPTDWYALSSMPYSDVGDRQCQVSLETHDIAGGIEFRLVPMRCRDRTTGKRIFAMGDSHATALMPIFELISAEQGTEISVYSFPGCSYIDFRAPVGAGRPRSCLEFVRAITDQTLSRSNPGDVVLLPSLRMERFGDQWGSFGVSDMYARMYNPKAMKLRQAALKDAGRWMGRFAAKSLNVVFVAPPPVFKAPPFRCSDWFNRSNPVCVEDNRQPRAEMERLRQPILDAMATLVQAFPNAKVWDPFPILCPGEDCLPQKDGRPLFFDGDHLSAYGNLTLYTAFKQMVSETLGPNRVAKQTSSASDGPRLSRDRLGE